MEPDSRRLVKSARLGLLIPILIAVLAAGVVWAQERFEDRVQVTEVQVPVRVLVKGDPVRGLTRDDFQLFEGKVEREILGFEVRDLTPLRAAPVAGGPGSQPAPFDPRQAIQQLLVLLHRERLRQFRCHPHHPWPRRPR